MLLRALLGFAAVACLVACSSPDADDVGGCKGSAGCATTSDRVQYEYGGSELDGDPALTLTHTPKGTLPNGAGRTQFVVSWKGTVTTVAPYSDAVKAVGVTTEQLPDYSTRFTWPSGAVATAQDVDDVAVRIVFTSGTTSITVTCRATPTTVVCS